MINELAWVYGRSRVIRTTLCQKASLLTVLMVVFGWFSAAQTAQPPAQYQKLARDIFRELVEIKSTESGVGSTTAAEAVSRRLLAAGFDSADKFRQVRCD